jgi:hypothetical protein
MRTAMLLLAAIVLMTAPMPLAAPDAKKIARDSLVEDVHQLADLIENVHPDPYINGGGRPAFDSRLESTLAGIPADGMTRGDFYRLLRPFVTAVGDAHTWLRDAYDATPGSRWGIPLYFAVVGTDLYVLAVPEERYRSLIGAVLVSVEGVPYADLVGRSRTMVSAENEYQLLRNLAYSGFLLSGPFLADLLPEWRDHSQVRLVLRHQDGAEVEHTIPVPSTLQGEFMDPGSRIERPEAGPSGFTCTFLDSQRTTALLIVDHMGGYREAFEEWRATDPASAERSARELYKRLHQADAPEGLDAVIAGLPSATETFRSLVHDMREAGTKSLVVDLRYDGGGNSAMYNILLYFLYGRDTLIQAKCQKTEIKRCSGYFPEGHSTEALQPANPGGTAALTGAEYDSSGDWYNRSRRDSTTLGALRQEFEREVEQMPTFAEEYRSGQFEHYYLPANVIVLSSPQTFSSGYTLMYYLYRAGATIVGTPSAQAGNCFGEPLSFELEHSGLTGTVSRKQYIYFHDDPEMGRVLRPQHMMTYEELRSYGFDLNAEILLALDLCRRRR